MVAFVASTVLTAANLNSAFNALTIRTVTGTSDTLVLDDNGGAVTYSNASATTSTIPPFSSVAYAVGTKIVLANLGAGVVTVTAGAGVTVNGTLTIAQNAGGTCLKTATNTWSFLPFGSGASLLTSADVTSTTGSPSITTTGIYTVYRWTGSGTLVLARSGYCDFLMAAGGSGGTSGATNGSGRVLLPTIELPSGTLTVTVGAGGPGGGNVDAISGFASVLGTLTTGRTGALAGPAANMPGYTSSITGTSITYGTGLVTTPTANRGEGGTNVGNTAGSSGVVIVRVVT